ncbi:Putative C-8 sterol isomerase [Rhizopus microsporus]|nr:Putative C-8 sterol isomerase [Rhizopus microsporus]
MTTSKTQETKKASCWTKVLFILTLLSALFVGLDQIKHQWYIFDPVVLQQIAQANIEKYAEWVFNNAGGAMGSMWVLHGSITEYLIFFGTPVGTEGHTGRFFADDYFIILEGEQWAYSAGQLSREVYKPGELHLLARGNCQQYKIPEHAWALEYAHGWIPTMLPFGFADTFFSTIDFPTLVKTIGIYTRLIVSELLQGKI